MNFRNAIYTLKTLVFPSISIFNFSFIIKR